MSLVAEWRGPHVLVRHREEPAWTEAFLTWAPAVPGQLFVLATRRVAGEPSVGVQLGSLLRAMLAGRDRTVGIGAIWLGAAGLARTPDGVWSACHDLGVDILAPDGVPVAMPGAAMYAGYGTGGTGWYRFRPGLPGRWVGTRYPAPAWERALPTEPVAAKGAVALPIPAGVAVRHSWAPAEHVEATFAVPVDYRLPKVVVGDAGPVPAPEQVASVLGELRLGRFQLVPGHPDVAAHVWQAELAMQLGEEVEFGTGTQRASATGMLHTTVPGARRFRPLPTVLRQPAGTGDQEVLAAAEPPPGWIRRGPRSWCPSDGDGQTVADVVPSGVVIRPAGSPEFLPPAPFDPAVWTLAIGVPGERVGFALLRAADRLLAGLTGDQRAALVVNVVGTLDEGAVAAAGRGALSAPELCAAVLADDTAEETDSEPAAAPDVEPAVTEHRIVTTSPVPVATVSGVPAGSVSSAGGAKAPTVPEPTETSTTTATAETATTATAEAWVEEAVAHPPEPRSEPAERPEPATQAPAAVLDLPDRASTAAEQACLAESAGERFAEALAAVNAAMASWPSLRQENDHGVKTDYVAVYLYFGTGEGAGPALNDAVHAGQDPPLAGHLPCLVSGVRRLPTHRRPVLRQGLSADAVERHGAPGTVLTEPGFLSASMELDITLPGAAFDVLIWPSTARRTTELLPGGVLNETIFMAGARFKALAVRTAAERADHEPGSPAAPRDAVLLRELAPGESPDSTELDDRDLAVLERLDRVLARRQEATIRLMDDGGAVARLTTSLRQARADAARRDQMPVETAS
ncbi:hypothetical protein [Amycolatopsis sp. cmx-4-54]|uniref:hypothetical protein n=1 Tax=Amycolatopsis sp. cmx-4-54 TaxID=2790936 RepID=UPI00397A4471